MRFQKPSFEKFNDVFYARILKWRLLDFFKGSMRTDERISGPFEYLNGICNGSELVLIIDLRNSRKLVVFIQNEMPIHGKLMIFALKSDDLHFISLGKYRIRKMLSFSKEDCLELMSYGYRRL